MDTQEERNGHKSQEVLSLMCALNTRQRLSLLKAVAHPGNIESVSPTFRG